MHEFSRKLWIEASQFNDLGEEAILEEVAIRVQNAHKRDPRTPTVVFDLDSTLYEVAPRTHAIIQEWLKSGHKLDPIVLQSLLQLKHEEVGYSLKDTFESVGLNMTEKAVYDAWAALKDFWWERFFASDYLKYDVPYPGAAAFARKIHDLGAHIVYLTGREESKMLRGTHENLLRDGFPMGSKNISLYLKKSATLADAEHKRKTAEHLEKTMQVIASFENEPHNVVALFETFPNALHIFMDTICSDKPARALTGLYRMKGFVVRE